MRVTFVLQPSLEQLLVVLDALAALNIIALKKHRLPPLYQAGVRYQPERRRIDDWEQAPAVYRRRHGDCEDLTAWRVAELRLGIGGNDPMARPDCYPVGKRWHAWVLRGDGTHEDPSRVLGMGRRRQA